MIGQRQVTYSQDDFQQAILAYRNKTMSSVDASKKFGVPESTIRKYKNKTGDYVKPGRSPLLSSDQEKYLVALLQQLESIGVRLNKENLSKITGDFINKVTGNNENMKNPGRHWFENFFKRNCDKLKMKKEVKLDNARRNGFTEEVRQGWFSKLKQILDANNLHARPNQIWNCDESGFSDDTQCEYVCVASDTKFAFEQHGGTGKSFTTMLLCTNAAGDVMPPLVVYSAKSLNPLWCSGGIVDATYKCSESGWISEEIFIDWFKNCFLERTKCIDRPLLLVMDNHSAHINIDVIEMALKNGIILLCLPPHTTHALQPLDVVTLSSAKKVWKKIVSKYFSRTGRKTIRKMDFPYLAKNLMDEAFTKRQCVSGFSRCGLWPFDDQVMKEKVAKKDRRSIILPTASASLSNNLSTSTVSLTHVQQSNHSPTDSSIIPISSFTDSIISTGSEKETSASIIKDTQNTSSIVHEINTGLISTFMARSPKTVTLSRFDDRNIMYSYPLTTTSPSIWDVYDANPWTNTDGPWSSRITGQVVMPVNGIEEYHPTSPQNKRMNMGSTSSRNKFMKYNNGSKSFDPNDEKYGSEDEQEKNFHELTSVPIHEPPFSPATVVQSIVTNCLQEMQPTTAPVLNKRVRLERRYGEEITAGNLLQELKQKKAVKDTQMKRPRRALKKLKSLVTTTNSGSLL